MTMNDGGPAFPRTSNGNTCPHHDGMTLRDFFAARVLPVVYADDALADDECMTLEEIANEAYRMADAMIEARGKGRGTSRDKDVA